MSVRNMTNLERQQNTNPKINGVFGVNYFSFRHKIEDEKLIRHPWETDVSSKYLNNKSIRYHFLLTKDTNKTIKM